MADGGMVALDVRRRTAVAGCRATWQGPTTPATRVHFARSLRPYGSTGVHLADCRRALLALENLTLI